MTIFLHLYKCGGLVELKTISTKLDIITFKKVYFLNFGLTLITTILWGYVPYYFFGENSDLLESPFVAWQLHLAKK